MEMRWGGTFPYTRARELYIRSFFALFVQHVLCIIQSQSYTIKWSVAVGLGVIILTTYSTNPYTFSGYERQCRDYCFQGDDGAVFVQHQDSLVVTIQLNP